MRGQPVYDQVFRLVFDILPELTTLKDIPAIKAMKGYQHRYRIRVGDYRIGIELDENGMDIMRVLHRREFYRYFP